MLLDTGILVEILTSDRESSRFKDIFDEIKEERRTISVLSLGELVDVMIRSGVDYQEPLERVKRMGDVVEMSEEISIQGAEIKNKRRREGFGNFSLMDGFILATARTINERLITTDEDFEALEDVIIV
ncbi:MAG: type II toxin-antitoxin system VapC family toxin [Candidatus Hydrothermarchaeales archaeon]